MGTDFRRVSSVTEFAIMGDSYDIPGKQLDGMNVLTVYDALQEAVEQTRNESEPLFFEINTYRYKGHSISDPAKYRTREELESYKQQDPILILKAQLLEENVITEDDFSSLDDEVRDICKEAADFADQSEEPPLEELHRDVLA
jgi:pyruvate dehydrogenase E1 component alpha subunit